MARTMSMKQLFLSAAIVPVTIGLSGCSLASLPANYSPIEKQTVEELSGSNYVPRSAEEREAIATQDMFAQTAFWSKEYDLNPADLEAAINLSTNLRKLGNPGKSIEIAQHTRALYPRDVDLMTELGASYIANNQTNEAIKIIDAALYQRPRSARLWSLKGAALDQLERFGEARQNYTKALRFAPDDASILANVGLSYALEGDPKTAELWLRRAASMPDASPNVRQNLALVLGLQGKLDEAERLAKQDLDQAGATNNLDYIRSLRGTSAATTQAKTIPAATQPAVTKQPTQRIYAPTVPKIPVQKTSSTGSQASNQTRQTVSTPQPRAVSPAPPQAAPTQFGAKLTVAGDPAAMKNGPQTVSEAAMEVLRQRNAALRNMPSNPQLASGPQQYVAPSAILNQISQNNTPKAAIARQQQQELARRAAYMQQQQYQQQQYQRQQNQQQPQQYYQYGQQRIPIVPNPVMPNGQPAPVQQPYEPVIQRYPTQQQHTAQQQTDRAPARDRRR